MQIDTSNQTMTISNAHVTEHDGENGLFIREVNHPELPQHFMVLRESDGSYVGSISDGSDCTFATLAEAQEYMHHVAAQDEE